MLRTRNEILQTHLNKARNASPKTVVWQLSPTPCMCNAPLIHDASDEVHTDGDQSNDTKDSTGSKTLLGGFCCTATC
jgi:hypothetical protein